MTSFVVQGHIYEIVQQKEWTDNLTERWNCVLSIVYLFWLFICCYALQMKQQQFNSFKHSFIQINKYISYDTCKIFVYFIYSYF